MSTHDKSRRFADYLYIPMSSAMALSPSIITFAMNLFGLSMNVPVITHPYLISPFVRMGFC